MRSEFARFVSLERYMTEREHTGGFADDIYRFPKEERLRIIFCAILTARHELELVEIAFDLHRMMILHTRLK